MNTITRLAGPLAVAALAAGLVAGPADARSTDVVRSGSCSGAADWKLKGGLDNGRMDVEFEVDSNRNGQVWRVAIWDNGSLVHRRDHRTVAPSGSFTVDRVFANRAGTDRIHAVARHLASGQVCDATISVG